MKLVITYIILALIATATNLFTQEISIHLYNGLFGIPISIFFGTATGLVIKYILDKRYIFKFQTSSKKHGTQTFVLYMLMGVVTTLIFLGFEFGFQYIFSTKSMRYLGAIIGLAIGYIAKYQLDKKYVFRAESL